MEAAPSPTALSPWAATAAQIKELHKEWFLKQCEQILPLWITAYLRLGPQVTERQFVQTISNAPVHLPLSLFFTKSDKA